MKPLQDLLVNASRSPKMIALSEDADARVIKAAIKARQDNVAKIILVGRQATILSQLTDLGGSDIDGIDIQDPAESSYFDDFAKTYYELRKHKGVSLDDAFDAMRQPHVYAAMLVRQGLAGGTVGGAVTTTADIVRAAIQVIGPGPGSKMVSSFFLMLYCKEHHSKKGAYVFADCGLVVDPNAVELAEIARASAKPFQALTGQDPRVAMLSFSTHDSASHESVTKVATATDLARTSDPALMIDGELQFDAAFVPEVAAAKAKGSVLDGEANVFVFPNLDSGNIAYKIAQRVGGASVVGPVLQGLAKPANDLSRGCSAEDVLHMIAVTCAQANARAFAETELNLEEVS
ncbi:phosphate acetyltransferase [Pseudohalocynthiibacter sp. F2068]|uniref:phosphate acetyltransferase n=1 Tax=Pseudohalocynthiibacter sp. F2068 TaxID=2926418 RepID=UPI001FF38F66|nr:phosphate acetyltransferase [Pseudohalocynthiibacter sp. F2068]